MAFSRLCPLDPYGDGKMIQGRPRSNVLRVLSSARHNVGFSREKQGRLHLFVSVRCCICNIFPRRHAATVTHITDSIWITTHASKSDVYSSLGNRMMGSDCGMSPEDGGFSFERARLFAFSIVFGSRF